MQDTEGLFYQLVHQTGEATTKQLATMAHAAYMERYTEETTTEQLATMEHAESNEGNIEHKKLNDLISDGYINLAF